MRPTLGLVLILLALGETTPLTMGQPQSATSPLLPGPQPQSAPQSQPASKLKADQPVYDFGKVLDDLTIEHNFKVTNTGSTPIQIKRVRTTCGCTTVNSQPQTLAPGASTEIGVKFSTRGINGKVTKAVYVETDDLRAPNVPLTLSGEVMRAFALTPPTAYFENLNRKTPSVMEFTLANNLAEPMIPGEVTSSASNVTAKLTEIEKGKQFKIALTANPPYPDSMFRGRLTIKTGIEKRPEFVIDFFGRPPPPIEVRPSPTIFLGQFDPAKEYKTTFRIVSADDTPFDIADFGCTNWRFSPALKQVRENREYELEITARPPYEWGVNRANLHVSTRSPAVPRLSFQVYGELKPPITVTPSSLLFKDLTMQKGGSCQVILQVVDGGPVEVRSLKSSLSNVKLKIESRDNGKSFVVTGTAEPPFPLGQLQGEVVLQTTHPQMKTIKLPIQSYTIAAPPPSVSVIPDPVLTLPPAGLSTAPSVARFIVRSNTADKVNVVGVELSNTTITHKIESLPGQEGRITYVYVTVPTTTELSPEGEVIVIRTDHKEYPRITRRIARAGMLSNRTPQTIQKIPVK